MGCVILLGLPIMISEFLIGRRSKANTAGAYRKLAPGTHWHWVGRMGVLAGFLFFCYYLVVGGWAFGYIVEAATRSFFAQNFADLIASFQQFYGDRKSTRLNSSHATISY